MSTPVVIDTDNSLGELSSEVDDAFALSAALGEPRLLPVGVTTVFGNTDVKSATRLTRELLDGLGAPELPLHPGAARPVRRPPRDGFPSAPDSPDAVASFARLARAHPGELVLVAIGPLTNVARFVESEPDAAQLLREIVVMGGTYTRTTRRSDYPGEFNFWHDPDAAATVFAAGIPLRLIGLDVTEQVRLSRSDAAALAALGGPLERLGRYATAWIDATAARRPRDPIAAESCAMHDALALAAVAHPELFEWANASVHIETESELTRGVVVADFLTRANAPHPNARIAVDVRVDDAKNWLMASLRQASAAVESQ